MYGKIIKLTAVLTVLTLILCGCDIFPSENGDLLRSPELTGDLLPVQKALTDSISGKFTLKYPSSGNYRSAFILTDLDGDTLDEAVAFYSTTVDGTVNMHINLITQTSKGWKSVADQKINAGNVEKVAFYDLDGDGVKEILVGWGIYSKIEKLLVAYSFSGNSLVSRLQESYTDFAVCDLENTHENNIMIVNLDSSYGYSFARYLKLTLSGVEELGICAVDKSVTKMETPVVTKLADNTPAMQFDAYKGEGILTQTVFFEDGTLKNAFYDAENEQGVKTFRSYSIKSKDINSDGIVEIPMSEAFPVPAETTDFEPSVLTKWCAISDKENAELIPVQYSVINYSDGYSLNIPSSLAGIITVKKDTEKGTQEFFVYNAEAEQLGEKLFTLKAFSDEDWDNNESSNFTEIARNKKAVYAFSLSGGADKYSITGDTILNSFFVLSEE